ncbi:C3HC4 type (RING finger) zinc finger protein [Phytophthora infestans]|uniref:C3HC4 type (RING finger) zinc finger protein n=1 Tax=Phytophthora infestans TaxID=4787 RepID=A0A833W8H2_PHYIN|nr:C3HC4 type (RING finger) zinc finger protein [Phytophthora infestans]
MPLVEADTEASLPEQTEEDRQWGLYVGDVVQIGQWQSKKLTYALYCGRGRVIHVWSPDRRSFRVRVDTLRGLKLSGYSATVCSRELDDFFHDLLNVDPVKPTDAIRRAKTVLHASAASRASSLPFILFARYSGDAIFTLLPLLKDAYLLTFDNRMFGTLCDQHQENSVAKVSPLDSPVRPTDRGTEGNNQAVAPRASRTKRFFGSVGDLLMSEWLGNALGDYFQDSQVRSNWYSIYVPPSILCLTPLLLQYDHQENIFRVGYNVARSLPHRLATDRMECGICWMDFTPLKVMLLKCQHYLCEPCLRLLPRRECPYCRGPIRHVQPVSEVVKQAALRLLVQAVQLEDNPPSPIYEEAADIDQEPLNQDSGTNNRFL